MGTGLAERPQASPMTAMRAEIMGPSARRAIEAALPAHVPVERFQRVLMTAVIHDDRLARVRPAKIVKAALKVAPLGLLTDPLLGEAYLIADGKGEVQARVGYRGLIKMARQSGQVSRIYAHEVRKNDPFECILGDQKKLRHRPDPFSDRGPVIGYYAVITYKDGYTDFEVMTLAQVEQIRERSDGWRAYKAGKIRSTPWLTDFDEMAKKTLLRRLLKRCPASADLVDALRLDAGAGDGQPGDATDITPPSTLDEFADEGGEDGGEPVGEDGEEDAGTEGAGTEGAGDSARVEDGVDHRLELTIPGKGAPRLLEPAAALELFERQARGAPNRGYLERLFALNGAIAARLPAALRAELEGGPAPAPEPEPEPVGLGDPAAARRPGRTPRAG